MLKPRMTPSDCYLLTIPSHLRVGGTTVIMWLRLYLKGFFFSCWLWVNQKRADLCGPDLITGVFKGREFSQAEVEGKSERFQALKNMKSFWRWRKSQGKESRWPLRVQDDPQLTTSKENGDLHLTIIKDRNLPSAQISLEADSSPESPDKKSAQPTPCFWSCETLSWEPS